MRALLDRFRALPRAGKWLAVFLAFVAAYFFVIEPAVTYHARVAASVDSLGGRVAEAAARAAGQDDDSSTLALNLTRFGGVELASDPAANSSMLVAEIGRILQEAGLDIETTTSSRNLGGNVRIGGSQIAIQTAEVRFTTTPAQAVEMIAALERSAVVTAVSRVSLQQLPNDRGKVRVTITCDSWSSAERSSA